MSANLYETSLRIIKDNQTSGGAYIASPNFPHYKFCWFRDSSYIAYAMDSIARNESSHLFHNWAVRTILLNAEKAERSIKKATESLELNQDYLNARYRLNGQAEDDGWPNFQLDGYGTWLWALKEHMQATGGRLNDEWKSAVRLASRYLSSLWSRPCYDHWEENREAVHVYTLISVYGGLKSAAELLKDEALAAKAKEIQDYTLSRGVLNGHLIKDIGTDKVDGALVAASTPFRLLPPDDPIILSTVSLIENHLRRNNGGVHRYETDTYYGGGEWVLLTAWLGWYYFEAGNPNKARRLLAWVEAQVNEKWELPEQVPSSLNDPSFYEPWVKRWGAIAQPLLWSHAKYLILRSVLA
ncbi:MAG: glycoside hydrolase family 15 protein [Spirochaetota bacterium]